jgi:hypothetical protein
VILPTSPSPTGSETITKTIGIIFVSRCSAAVTCWQQLNQAGARRCPARDPAFAAYRPPPIGTRSGICAVLPAQLLQRPLERFDEVLCLRIIFRVGHEDAHSANGPRLLCLRDALKFRCPLYPRKRTFAHAIRMSALGQKATCWVLRFHVDLLLNNDREAL